MNIRLRLFPKYALLILGLVAGLLTVSGAISSFFAYQRAKDSLVALQIEKALHAATRIDQYIADVENQLKWTELPAATTSDDAASQHRIDSLKLLRLVPAIAEVTWIDAQGREQLVVSRINMEQVASGSDRSNQAEFLNTRNGASYYGPVYFVKRSEPYLNIARPALGGGATVVAVNLKFVWDVVSQITIGDAGQTYVIDAGGQLIAHPDISQVLKGTSVRMPDTGDKRIPPSDWMLGVNFLGQEVLAALVPIQRLKWTVIVESPRSEMTDALLATVTRAAILLVTGLLISIVASFILARALVRPLRILQDGAARIGAGAFDQAIDIHTGDEIETLAKQFNQMGSDLKNSYADLESKVIARTAELQQEQSRAQELLYNILPIDIAQELSSTGTVRPGRHEAVTILFTDFSGFTQAVSTMPADRMVSELNEIFAAFDDITDECGVEKIKTIGDAYMAAAGLPKPCADHAQRCVRAGLRMVEFLEQRNVKAPFKWQVRIGIHSGPVVAGMVGKRKYAFDIWGDSVNVASRMESSGEAGRVNVSAYTYDLIQNDFTCEYRGKVDAKGKGSVDMYFVMRTIKDT